MTSERIPVAPSVLVWARESIGLSIERAASKIGVSQSILEQWESGELEPTIVQLRKAAKQYKRPLAALLLDSAPTDFDAIRDFRRLKDDEQAEWSPELHGEYRRAVAQREVFLELAELAAGIVPESQPFPGLELSTDVESAGRELREFLAVEQREFPSPHKALNAWISAAESKGVLVMQTQSVAVQEMRGFSLSEWPYPVVALNGGDYPRGRLFTLLHELAHLALNSGGLCDLHEVGLRFRAKDIDLLEHYCNQVAASTLMPAEVLLKEPELSRPRDADTWTLPLLGDLAMRYSVSSEALLLRLISLDKATWETFRLRKPELDAEYAAAKERDRKRQRESEGGPSYYQVKVRDLGRGYVRNVLNAFYSHQISSLDVADFLDVKFNQLGNLEEVAGR